MKHNLLKGAFTAMLLGAFMSSHAQSTMYGLTTSNSIMTMASASAPSTASGPYSISGVATGQALIALDSRSSNGQLYALGYNNTTSQVQLYTITHSGTTYTANPVGSASSMDLGSTNSASFDFVSTVDNQIRIIGRNGNSYMMNANNGAILSTGTGSLSYASGDAHAGASAVIGGTAYLNNFYGSDATQEVAYDMTNNVLLTFDAGNYSNGFNNASDNMHSIGIGTGLLLTGTEYGMDSWYDSATHHNTVYLAGSTLLGTHLYSYDMNGIGSGIMTDLGTMGDGSVAIRDIAFEQDRNNTTYTTGQTMTALTLNLRNLVFFNSEHPDNINRVRTLTGMTSGQAMVAIDYGFNGMLYGLGYNSSAHNYQLYTIDTATGNVTAVNSSANALDLGNDDGSGNRLNVGFRFISTASNRIRVIGNNGSTNVQLNAATGAIASADASMGYATGDTHFGTTASITSIAYTGFEGDSSTQMFGFDANLGIMLTFDNSDGATGYGDGTNGYYSSGLDLSSILDLSAHSLLYNNSYMDMMYDQATSANIGFMASNFWGDSSYLNNYAQVYDMTDVLAGYHKGTASTPTKTGTIGEGIPVKDMTISKQPVTTAVQNVANTTANDLLVYPNPAISNTHIVLPAVATSTVAVDVIDMNGRVTNSYEFGVGSHDLNIDLSTLPTGLYSVRVAEKGQAPHNLKVLKTN